MTYYLGNCAIEGSDAEEILSSGCDVVYMIDEINDIFYDLNDAMRKAEELADGWVGNVYVSECKVNFRYGEDGEDRYALIDVSDSPLVPVKNWEYDGKTWAGDDSEFRVLPDYVDRWSSDAAFAENPVVPFSEIVRLASEWDTTVRELLRQVEEI